jgi:hypothetical protein
MNNEQPHNETTHNGPSKVFFVPILKRVYKLKYKSFSKAPTSYKEER